MTTLATLTDRAWFEPLGWALLHSFWQCAAIGLLAWAALAALGGRGARARYAVACLALALMITAPAATWFGAWRSAAGSDAPIVASELSPALVPEVTAQLPEYSDFTPQTAAVPPEQATAAAALSPEPQSAETQPAETQPVLAAAAVAIPSAWRDSLRAWLPWIVALWFAGVALLSVRLVADWLSLFGLKALRTAAPPEEWIERLNGLAGRMRVSRPVRLLESGLARVPCVVGWLKPVILIPAGVFTGLSPRELEAILAHELAHIRRHDYIINLAQTVIETMLFYHPAVWWLSARIRTERENCCDDLAIEATGDRRLYARALVRIEESRAGIPRPALAFGGSGLLARVRRVLGVSPPRRAGGRTWLAGWITLAIAATMITVPFVRDGLTDDPEETTNAEAEARVDSDAAENARAPVGPARLEYIPGGETADPGTLSGRVVDEAGNPLEGVLVELWTRGNRKKTDADGNFSFEDLEQDRAVEIRFSLPGYSPRLFARQPVGLRYVVVTLDDDTYFEGRVTTADGRPVPNALIRANQGPKDADGYRITDIWTETHADADGSYRLHLDADDFVIHVSGQSGGETFTLRRSESIGCGESRALDLVLTPGAVFRARVIDTETREPVEGFRLYKFQTSGLEGRSDAEGRMEISGLTEGPLEFDVQPPKQYFRWWSEQAVHKHQRFHMEERYEGWQRNFDGLEFEIARGMDEVVIEVEKGVEISGRVLDPNGKGVVGATVAPALTGTGNSITGDTRFSTRTRLGGRYTMRLPASKKREYNVIAHDGTYGTQRYWGGAAMEPIITQPGDVIENCDITLNPPGTVRGRVVDQAGNPVEGRDVRAHPADRRGSRYYDPTVKTDANGEFAITGIRPGENYIQVDPFWLYADDAPGRSTTTVDVAGYGTVEGVQLVADDEPGGPESPQAGPTLKVGDKAPELAGTTIDGDEFVLSALKGKVVLLDFWATWCHPCIEEIPSIARAWDLYRSRGLEIVGVSFDQNPKALAEFVTARGDMPWTHLCDEKGWTGKAAETWGVRSIPFAVLIDGEGVIRARNLRGRDLWNQIGALLREREAAAKADSLSDTESAGDLDPDSESLLRGTVLLPDGSPAPKAEVWLATPERSLYLEEGGVREDAFRPERHALYAETDERGEFAFPAPGGIHTFVVLDDRGFAEVRGEEFARAGGRIRLQEWAAIEGILKGTALPGGEERLGLFFEDRVFRADAPGITHAWSAKPDAEGRFRFDRVPPFPDVRVDRTIRLSQNKIGTSGFTRIPGGLKPGETAQVVVGGRGPTVTGRFVLPGVPPDEIDYSRGRKFLATVYPDLPEELRDAGDDAVDAFWRASGVREVSQLYDFGAEADGTFRIVDVVPGYYRLHAVVEPQPPIIRLGRDKNTTLASVVFDVRVPETANGASETIDLGVVEMTAVKNEKGEVAASVERDESDRAEPQYIPLDSEEVQTTRVITGIVEDPEGRPVPDAEILVVARWDDDAARRTIRSGADGTFEIPDFHEGTGRSVSVRSAAGFAPEWPGERWLELPMEQRRLPYRIQLQRPIRTAGRVLDEAGGPVAGARVVVCQQHIIQPDGTLRRASGKIAYDHFVTESGKDGRFEFAETRPGSVSIFVEHPDHSNGLFDEVETGIEDHELKLKRGLKLTGRVTHEGRPIEGIEVLAASVSLGSRLMGSWKTVSGPDGSFTIDHITDLSFETALDDDPRAGVRVDSEAWQSEAILHVFEQPDGSLPEVELRIAPVAEGGRKDWGNWTRTDIGKSVKVAGEDGTKVSPATVTVKPGIDLTPDQLKDVWVRIWSVDSRDPVFFETARFQSDGFARREDLPPGRYKAGLHGIEGVWFPDKAFEIEAGEEKEVLVPTDPDTVLRGKLNGFGPVPGKRHLSLFHFREDGRRGNGFQAIVHEDGTFEARGLEPGPWLIHHEGDSIMPTQRLVNIVSGENNFDVTLPQGRIQGRLTGFKYAPGRELDKFEVGNILVAPFGANYAGGSEGARVRADRDGNFEVLHVAPGRYFARADSDAEGRLFITDVTLGKGEASARVELSPPLHTGQVRGRVSGIEKISGSAFSSVSINAQPRDEESGYNHNAWHWGPYDPENMEYSIDHLPAGDYLILAKSAMNRATVIWQEGVGVREGAARVLDIDFPADARMVKVSLDTGGVLPPVAEWRVRRPGGEWIPHGSIIGTSGGDPRPYPGEFALPPGDYEFLVAYGNNYPTVVAVKIEAGEGTREIVLPGPPTAGLASGETGLTISGYIGSETHRVAPIHVRFDAPEERAKPVVWDSADGGRLVSSQLTPGRRTVQLVHLDDSGGAWFSETRRIDIENGRPVELNLGLRPGVRLTGTLDKSVPRPVKNGRVTLLAYPDFEWLKPEDLYRFAWTDWQPVGEDGSFSFASVPPGHVELSAICEGFMTIGDTGRDRTRANSPQLCEVGNGGAEVVLSMKRTGTVEVTVVGPDGEPLRGAQVAFTPNIAWGTQGANILGWAGMRTRDVLVNGHGGTDLGWDPDHRRRVPPSFIADTDDRGVAVITSLPPGEQFARVTCPEFRMQPEVVSGIELPRDEAMVRIRPGRTAALQVRMAESNPAVGG